MGVFGEGAMRNLGSLIFACIITVAAGVAKADVIEAFDTSGKQYPSLFRPFWLHKFY
jgi:hypothetical protein